MTEIHRVYGIEFTAKRTNTEFPLSKEVSEDLRTGYQAGIFYAKECDNETKNITENSILRVYNIRFDGPLEMRFSDLILLDDLVMSAYVEDFIAGFEDFNQVKTSARKSFNINRIAIKTALRYGISEIPLKEIEDELVHSSAFETACDWNLPGEDDNVPTRSSFKEIHDLAEKFVITDHFPSSDVGYQIVVSGMKHIVRPAVAATIEQMVVYVLFYDTLNIIFTRHIEEMMFQQYRAKGVSRLMQFFRENEGERISSVRVPNVYE